MPRRVLYPVLATLSLTGVACSEFSSTAGPDHCNPVDDEVWGRDLNPHTVTCSMTVEGELVIGPGARIRFEPDVTLTINGSLRIEGEPGRPVHLEAAGDGSWGGIRVNRWTRGDDPDSASTVVPPRTNQGEVVLRHAVFSGAGVASGGEAGQGGSLIIDRSNVTLEGVEIQGSRQCGLTLGAEARLTSDSADLEISGANQAAICAHPRAVTTLPDGIELDVDAHIDVSAGELSGRHVWSPKGYPLRLAGDVEIFRGELVLEPGLDLRVANQTSILVGGTQEGPQYGVVPEGSSGAYRRDQASRLVARGTSSAPVTFSLAPTGAPESAWGGLHFVGGPGEVTGELHHVRIEGAGASVVPEPASLTVRDGAVVSVNEVDLVDGLGAGVYLDGGTFDPDSSGLSITDHAYPVVAAPSAASSLPHAGSSYVGNGRQGGVSASGRAEGNTIYLLPGSVAQGGLFKSLGVTYRADGDLDVRGTELEPGELAIEPGVRIRFLPGRGLTAGVDGPSAVHFGESDSAPVTLSGLDGAESPWRGLTLGPALLPSSLRRVTVDGAGSSGQAVEVAAHDLLIDDLSITDHLGDGLALTGTFHEDSAGLLISGGEGVLRADAASVASLPRAGASLSALERPWILVQGTRLDQSGTWRPFNLPYRINQILTIRGAVTDTDELEPARLILRPGTQITFGPSGGLRTERYENDAGDRAHGSLEAIGLSTSPIAFSAADPDAGFVGLTFRNEDFLREEASIPFPPAGRSALEHVLVDGGGALAALGAVTFDTATPSVEEVSVVNSLKFGVVLLGRSFTDGDETRCETFDRSHFSFSDNLGDERYEGQLGEADLDVLDLRADVVDCSEP
ncbi:MAG: hypothetical protein EA397_12680 [Deltaproteobacteria bacterium]|nr:MAG: hypothetical protein EA397_12680 [Deltaproteobacteria bacterium]